MTVPNLLSLFRIIGTFFFIFFMFKEEYNLAFIIFLLQGLSDLADGLIARLFEWKTDLGAFLDPLADKIMLVSSYLILSYKSMIPKWVAFIVVFRDFFVLAGFLFLYTLSCQNVPRPRILGKICTVVQVLTVSYVLWSVEGGFKFYFFYITVFFTLLSGIDYLLSGIRLLARLRLLKG